MTPEEAIEILEKLVSEPWRDKYKMAMKTAIKALEEIQLYKENKLCLVPEDAYSRQCCELDAYKEIGTVEECRKAVEKQKPEKPEIYTDTIQTISSSFNRDVYLCSRCGQFIGNIDDELPRYCNCCGQRIDEDLEGMEDERD